jgi:hypothetical protein
VQSIAEEVAFRNRGEDERGQAMTDTTNPSRLDALREQMERLAKNAQPVHPELSQAVRDLLTASNYADDTLINSSLNSVFEALTGVVRDIIEREVKVYVETKKGLQELWREYIDSAPRENFDELRKMIESFIDERIARMTGLRDELVKVLEERDYQVENAQQLEDTIRDLRRFRENILKDWPASGGRPAPINRQAIAEARKAIGRGEKGMRREDLVHPKKKAE